MKKFLSFTLALMLLVTMAAFPVSADEVIGELETTTDVTPMNATAAVHAYFSDREEFLKNNEITDFNSANDAVVNDEVQHRAALNESGITILSSEVSVIITTEINQFAEISATETIEYSKDGICNTETVAHEIVVYLKENATPYVISDSYMEAYSDFSSCSYVSPTASTYAAPADNDGSKHCLINVAKSEVGNTYTDNNKFTQYTCGYAVAWCACFVSWCGYQANIPTSIIPKGETVSYVAYYANFANGVGNGGYRTPQVGDLVIWEDYSHIGIVSAVNSSSQTFSIIHGNWGDQVVHQSGFAFTDSRFEGFCRPQYSYNNHTYTYTITDSWHTSRCVNCGYTTARTSHVYLIDADGNEICVCGHHKSN